MITSHFTLIRRAAELVLHYDKTLRQCVTQSRFPGKCGAGQASEPSRQIGSNIDGIRRVHFGILRMCKLHNGLP